MDYFGLLTGTQKKLRQQHRSLIDRIFAGWMRNIAERFGAVDFPHQTDADKDVLDAVAAAIRMNHDQRQEPAPIAQLQNKDVSFERFERYRIYVWIDVEHLVTRYLASRRSVDVDLLNLFAFVLSAHACGARLVLPDCHRSPYCTTCAHGLAFDR